jgi:beta-glucanase (GH16 family)
VYTRLQAPSRRIASSAAATTGVLRALSAHTSRAAATFGVVGCALLAAAATAPSAAAATGDARSGAALGSAAGPSCGGLTLHKADGGVWRCSFDDEFSGTHLDATTWTPQRTATSGFTTGPSAYRACYVNSAKNISVSNGYLNLTARQERQPFSCTAGTRSFTTQYTAGEVSTYYSLRQQYGRFAVRAKLPQTTAAGLQETLWLWPTNDLKYGAWPSSGEIDFAEIYSKYYYLNVPYIHYVYDPNTRNASTHTNVVTAYNCTINYAGFNTYLLEWLPGRITIKVNGTTCLVDNYQAFGLAPPAPFDQPFFLALTQALGVGANAFDPSTTPLPATTRIDYVRVWK